MFDQWFVDLVCNALQIEPGALTPELAIGDLEQWDSVSHLSLIMEIEQHLGVRFDVEAILAAQSLGDIWGNLVTPATNTGQDI